MLYFLYVHFYWARSKPENIVQKKKKISPKKISPLRYPGGKGSLGPWLGQVLEFNNITQGCYVEPFAGGAGAALYLLLSEQVDHIVLNDADPAIHALWHSIIFETSEFLKKMRSTEVTIPSWNIQKNIIQNPKQYSSLDLGFAAFFLNRTNVSGIIKGGVIGGKNQQGKYKIDARFNKTTLEKRIVKISQHRSQITLFNLDTLDLLKNHVQILPNNTILYLDPPYYVKGSQLYRNFYKHQDHVNLSQQILQLEIPWLVSYDNCSQIKEIYKNCPNEEFSLRYSASQNKRTIATEIIFHNNVKLPSKPQLVKT